jgi:hypothetical protein
MPAQHDWQYFFTGFAINLNYLPENMKRRIPRTDSRLRPDLRALEENNLEVAAEEKHRLEEKQRAIRKKRELEQEPDFKPKYFKQIMDPDSNEQYYAYGPDHGCRDYWEDRRNNNFAHMEDIY